MSLHELLDPILCWASQAAAAETPTCSDAFCRVAQQDTGYKDGVDFVQIGHTGKHVAKSRFRFMYAPKVDDAHV